MVAIARALEIESAQVLILDEPTSSLSSHETDQLFEVMRRLKGKQVGIIFITHFIEQVYRISDRLTVIRNGRLVGTYETSSLPRMDLVEKMIGRTITEFDEMSKIKALAGEQIGAQPIVTTRQLGLSGDVEPFDLKLYPGQVLGIAGLVGSGRTEAAGLLYGLVSPDKGSMEVDGRPVHKFSPLASILRGLVLTPEDRKAAGVVDDLSVRENLILALQVGQGWFKYLNRREQNEIDATSSC
jgi:simple sugar transport system ATP-binding protein